MGKTKKLLDPGFLDYAFSTNVVNPKTIQLTTTDLSVLTNIYGHLYTLSGGDLYDLLFETDAHSIDTPAGTINTGDLRQFTLMRYLLPVSSYWKPDKRSAYLDTAYCGGTPLALLGARNKCNLSYNEWQKGVDLEDIRSVQKLDLFLGFTLASTTIDQDTGETVWKSGDGLARFIGTGDLFNARDIRDIRDANGHGVTEYRTRKADLDIPNIAFYNDATGFMRHMIRQTWCWYGKHRCSNMICHWSDWDKIPKDIDSITALEGYEAVGATAPSGWKNIVAGGKL